ncbi:uncharacterized protein [Antedon mediterranea]|uniref:uncharacterized protein n=1 Tax=Antedon mediterranea TaxID=105859 RepID=UPI003AF652B0
MIRTLPIKWLQVQQEIQGLKRNFIYIPTAKIFDLLNNCRVTKDHRVLLEYLHDIGEILYYPDDNNLKDIIVIDLMRLVDVFKTIITVKDPEFQDPDMSDAWDYLEYGILKGELLEHLLKNFKEYVTLKDFVSLMQKFGLMTERKSTKNGERMFYVLPRLKPEAKGLPQFEEKRAVSLFHDFGRYLPDDLFQSAATKFIEKFQMEDYEPQLSYEHVEMNIDADHLVILYVATIKHCRMLQTTIVRTKSFTACLPEQQCTEDDKPLPDTCKKVLCFLQEELKVFSQKDARGLEVRMCIPCTCSPNIQNAHMHNIRKFDKDELPCRSNKMEVKLYRKLFGENVLPKDNSKSQDDAISTKSHLKGYVDDKTIRKVAEEIHDWKIFGVRLGMSWTEVKHTFGREMESIKAAEKMMKCWRTNCINELNQLEVVCIALIEHGNRKLASTFIEDIKEKSESLKNADCFDDQDVLFICENLKSEWRRLAVRLGIEWRDIINITNNNYDVKDSIMEVLISWRNNQPSDQIPIMINALRQQKCVALSDLLCKRHAYKYNEGCLGKLVLFTEQLGLNEGFLTDLAILIISEMMDEHWKDFCTRLLIDDAELCQIAVKFRNEIVESTTDALVRWRERQDSSVNQWADVKKILEAMGKTHIVDELEEKNLKKLPLDMR